MLNTQNYIDNPIVYVYCPVVYHQFLCKNYYNYNDWACSCKYKILYVRNYVKCSDVTNEYDLIKYNSSVSDINNFNTYWKWRENMSQTVNN